MLIQASLLLAAMFAVNQGNPIQVQPSETSKETQTNAVKSPAIAESAAQNVETAVAEVPTFDIEDLDDGITGVQYPFQEDLVQSNDFEFSDDMKLLGEAFVKTVLKDFFEELRRRPKLVDEIMDHKMSKSSQDPMAVPISETIIALPEDFQPEIEQKQKKQQTSRFIPILVSENSQIPPGQSAEQTNSDKSANGDKKQKIGGATEIPMYYEIPALYYYMYYDDDLDDTNPYVDIDNINENKGDVKDKPKGMLLTKEPTHTDADNAIGTGEGVIDTAMEKSSVAKEEKLPLQPKTENVNQEEVDLTNLNN